MKTKIVAAIFLALSGCLGLFAQQHVVFVTGEEAPPLEIQAAEQLAGQFEELFELEVTLAHEFPEGPAPIVLIGSPKTNPLIENDDWPEGLSEQGHVVKSLSANAVIVGGETPAASYWAACELAQQFGIRFTLHGDFMPVEKPEFVLGGFEIVLEPKIKHRAWRVLGPGGPASQESWGLDETRQLLRQLAKLKFNHVVLDLAPGRPFLEAWGEGFVFGGQEFPVDGETAGRSVFGGAKAFENPDFAGEKNRLEAGKRLANGIIATAHELGMSTSITTDPKLKKIAESTYPKAGEQITAVALPDAGASILPQLTLGGTHAQLEAARDIGGAVIVSAIPGDCNLTAFNTMRSGFGERLDPETALAELLTPICGDEVSDRVQTAYEAIERARKLLLENDPTFVRPHPDMFLKHYQTDEAAPEWWAEAKAAYGEAVNEMYRANTRARGGARELTLYHAKRFTFALHYLTAVESVRAAGIAKAAGDVDAQIENLELAIEAMHNALGIYADVARDNSDRGVIALLNKYGYRPLLEELDKIPLP